MNTFIKIWLKTDTWSCTFFERIKVFWSKNLTKQLKYNLKNLLMSLGTKYVKTLKALNIRKPFSHFFWKKAGSSKGMMGLGNDIYIF